jgi:alkanesulfonate monooxygenase SsuD/methylene tetrahydromethanopterin reductase-like flavin-dependent oxidoreductase (luciferase family)
VIAKASRTSRTDDILRLGREKPFSEVAALFTGLPGGLEFTGTPEEFADLIESWVTAGAADGFTLQPTILPSGIELFTEHVVPLLQKRGLFRTSYTASTLRGHLRDDR